MLIDTSVWLSLGRDPKDGALITIIESLLQKGMLSLIVPSVVLKEFLANRERVTADYGRRLTAHFKVVRDAVIAGGGKTPETLSVLGHLDQVDRDTARRGQLAAQTLRQLERLLTASPTIEPSDSVKMRVAERALDWRAPFHRGKNAAADAVIIETYAELVGRASGDASMRFIFVTANTEDFSAADQNEKNPHADYECFSPGKSAYFISLPDALRSVDQTSVNDMLKAWELEQPTVADLIRRYVAEAESTHPLGVSHRAMLLAMADSPLGRKIGAKLKASDIVEHGKRRHSEGKAPSTVLAGVIQLLGVLRAAEEQWGILGVSRDPVDEARRELISAQLASKSVARSRRPTAEELDRLTNYFAKQYRDHPKTVVKMSELIAFTLSSGRGLNEICALRWVDFDRLKQKACVVHLRKSRRSSSARQKEFPLTEESVQIILRQPRDEARIFPFNPQSSSQNFKDGKNHLRIPNLRFQDLRREAVMRMFDAKLPLERIESLTGLSLIRLQQHRRQWEADRGLVRADEVIE